MAEASGTGILELNPDYTEFASQGRHGQHQPRRGWPRSGQSRNYGGRYAGSQAQPRGEESASARNQTPFHKQDDGGRGKGRGGRGGGGRVVGGSGHQGLHNQRWQQRPGGGRNFPHENYGASGGHQRAQTPPMDRPDLDGPSWRREDRRGSDGAWAPEDHPETRAKAARRFAQEPRRGAKEMGARGGYRRENRDNHAAEGGLDTIGLTGATGHPESGSRNKMGWRLGDRNTNSDGKKKAPAPRHLHGSGNDFSHQWKETDGGTNRYSPTPPSPRDVLDPSLAEQPSWRGGRGPGRRPFAQERGQRRPAKSDHGPVLRRQVDVPKNKETHTGCLIEQLSEEKYECMVCCDVIRLMAPVWSCLSCFHVFHLNCIKKWARSPASQAEDVNEGWRCPACQNASARVPNSYMCFCGKVTNPEWQRTEIPHSCGEMCGKKRSGPDCNHPCNILCHPGPCPQCPAFVTKECICRKTSRPVRCGQAVALRCDQVCGAKLNCGEHSCAQVCHSGNCPPCQLGVEQVCYCGAISKEVLCGTNKDKFDGSGNFSCERSCGKLLDCGNHQCRQACHPGACSSCPQLPQVVRSCPCGQTSLSKLLELGYAERRSCTDPIPSCGKTCGKPLPCGSDDVIHMCESMCHEGSCGPCSLNSAVKCRCGFKTKDVPCASVQNKGEFVFTCEKRCSRKRSCGRHKCGELCCVDVEHKCSLICGYKLNCGLHRCQDLCHRGNCQPCWQTSFDELACHCGETVMYPPIPCGTKPPECKNLCTRRHDCDHPVFHNCHGDEKCPPCTYLTTKWCMGSHEQRSNIPCHLLDISCGLPCGKVLPCAMHQCPRICHRGECLTEGSCRQPCLTPRDDCGHPCAAPCHQGTPCPRGGCNAKVVLHCDCGRRKETVICTDAASSYQRIAAIAMASKLSDMQLGDSVDIGQLVTKKELKQTRLECDQDCAALERNRRLAEALQIDQSADPFNLRSSTSKYSDSLKEDARKELKFVSEVEEEMKNLVELANKGKQTKRSHCFPPMNREHRKIIHELAEAYGVDSVAYDSEPKRNVVITAVRGKSACPGSMLTALIERETIVRAPPPIAHVKQHGSKNDGGAGWMKPVEEPVIDYFDVQD